MFASMGTLRATGAWSGDEQWRTRVQCWGTPVAASGDQRTETPNRVGLQAPTTRLATRSKEDGTRWVRGSMELRNTA